MLPEYQLQGELVISVPRHRHPRAAITVGKGWGICRFTPSQACCARPGTRHVRICNGAPVLNEAPTPESSLQSQPRWLGRRRLSCNCVDMFVREQVTTAPGGRRGGDMLPAPQLQGELSQYRSTDTRARKKPMPRDGSSAGRVCRSPHALCQRVSALSRQATRQVRKLVETG